MTQDDSLPPRRRRALAMIGGSLAWLAAPQFAQAAAARTNAKMCVVRPRQVEGPFFVETDLRRSDIRSDPKYKVVSAGVPVRITFRVSRLSDGACEPLPDARVDLWHCDAEGLYSDTERWQESTKGFRNLRGYQITDRKGLASFTTIFPGWYPNRTVHMHYKVRTDPEGSRAREHTSQIYFDDELTDEIHQQEPYAARGPRKVRNNRDLIFRFGGNRLILPLREERRAYVGVFDLALEM